MKKYQRIVTDEKDEEAPNEEGYEIRHVLRCPDCSAKVILEPDENEPSGYRLIFLKHMV